MTPRILGSGMSGVEVINITKHGIWLVTRDHELFISFKEFPWFRDVTVRKLMNVEQSTPARLYWPDLGIDLAVESVRRFPLLLTKMPPKPRSDRHTKTEPLTQSKSSQQVAPLRTSPKTQSANVPRAPHFPHAIDQVTGDERDTQ